MDEARNQRDQARREAKGWQERAHECEVDRDGNDEIDRLREALEKAHGRAAENAVARDEARNELGDEGLAFDSHISRREDIAPSQSKNVSTMR